VTLSDLVGQAAAVPAGVGLAVPAPVDADRWPALAGAAGLAVTVTVLVGVAAGPPLAQPEASTARQARAEPANACRAGCAAGDMWVIPIAQDGPVSRVSDMTRAAWSWLAPAGG